MPTSAQSQYLSAANTVRHMDETFDAPEDMPEGAYTPTFDHATNEYKAPSAPPTPRFAKRLAIHTPYNLPEPNLPEPADHIIRSSDMKCALCHHNCSDMSPPHRISHMNKCRTSLIEATPNNPPNPITTRANPSRQPAHIAPYLSAQIPSSPHTPTKPLEPNQPPTSPPFPPSSCTICKTWLSRFPLFSACTHRAHRVGIFSPQTCPVCAVSFAAGEEMDVLWRFYRCRCDAGIEVRERDGIVALMTAWRGCREVVGRAVVREGKEGGGGAWGYKQKMDEGRDVGDGGYWVGSSGLRMACVVKEGGGLEVRMSRNLAVPRGLGMKRFRRRVFGVLEVPRGCRIPEGVEWEKVDVSVEEIPDPMNLELPGFDEKNDGDINMSSRKGMRVNRDRESEVEDAGSTPISSTFRPPPGIPHPTTTLAELDALLEDLIHT